VVFVADGSLFTVARPCGNLTRFPFHLPSPTGTSEELSLHTFVAVSNGKSADKPTLAVRQQSQTIRFKSAAQMLDTFGMARGGKEYRRLVAAFERIFGATIFLVPTRSAAGLVSFTAVGSTSSKRPKSGTNASPFTPVAASVSRT
jgi:hypothetical protein